MVQKNVMPTDNAECNNVAGLSQWKADSEHLLRDVQDVLPRRGRGQVLRKRLQDI